VTMPPEPRPKRFGNAAGRPWLRLVKAVVQRDFGRCWICGHYGAKSADHVVPETEGGETTLDNLKAAHAVGSPCTDCSYAAGKPIFCNELKGGYSVERARRKIEERTGLRLGGEAPSGPEGRDWLLLFVVLGHD
jgi:hypothetical protein